MMYYVLVNNQQYGPMGIEELQRFGLTANMLVRRDGEQAWLMASQMPELAGIVSACPPYGADQDSKRLVCGLLSILIGGLGIQYFLIGKTAAGIYTILLSLVTCGLWSVITLIQGILMLCMTDAEFERKYVHSTSSFPIF